MSEHRPPSIGCRVTWIFLVLLGILPGISYYLVRELGMTKSLHYISTTAWQIGAPSLYDMLSMFLSLFTWGWLNYMTHACLLAAAPFVLWDLWKTAKLRRKEHAHPAEQG